MKQNNKSLLALPAVVLLFSACHTLERASIHGFNSGYYKLKSAPDTTQRVYVDRTEDKIDVYRLSPSQPDKKAWFTILLEPADSVSLKQLVFKKQSLDVDITSVLLKYRPAVYGLRPQATTDFNFALYAGWRYDNYHIQNRKDPLGRQYNKITSRGYDFGVFAGPGVTQINPFTTRNAGTNEYSALALQTGVAGFIESSLASFGFAAGLDHLLNADRKIWIYRRKPWVGFIVGIALN